MTREEPQAGEGTALRGAEWSVPGGPDLKVEDTAAGSVQPGFPSWQSPLLLVSEELEALQLLHLSLEEHICLPTAKRSSKKTLEVNFKRSSQVFPSCRVKPLEVQKQTRPGHWTPAFAPSPWRQ